MLTRTFSATSSQLRPCRSVALALALLGASVIFAPAYAGGIDITNCSGVFRTFSCITAMGSALTIPACATCQARVMLRRKLNSSRAIANG